jgi:hypothetical protein
VESFLNPPMRRCLVMEDGRRKERREKRVDPNLVGDISLLESPRKNVGTATRSGISKEHARKKKKIRRKIMILMMSLKIFSRGWWRCLCCIFGNPCREECMVDRLWSFLPYDFSIGTGFQCMRNMMVGWYILVMTLLST